MAAGWDEDLLKAEFEYLSDLPDDFDLTLTGFELPEIDAVLHGSTNKAKRADRLDRLPADATDPPVTREGDVWVIGHNRLICGNALDAATYEMLMAGEKADLVFSDPPFNLPINGHVSGLGQNKHREFCMASGEMSKDEFTKFLFTAFSKQAAHSKKGSIHFHCMDWRHAQELLTAGSNVYDELKNVCVWAKSNAGMGSLYRSGHELVFVYKYGSEQHYNAVELGKHGRYRTNLWTYPGANSFGPTRDADLAMHPTVKPVAMVADAIMDCSRRGEIVLDAFAGSGTTLVAAQKTKRRGFGIEIDPIFCDLIIRRMRDLFKIEAVLLETGKGFEEVGAERAAAFVQEVGA